MHSKNRLQLRRRMGSGFFLILILLLFAGCGLVAEQDFTPLASGSGAVAAELPGGVKMARDAALTYVVANFDAQIPMRDAEWAVEYDVQEDFMGGGAYRMMLDGCVLHISSPLMFPETSYYHVILDDAAAGLHWEGDVDCQGQVLQPWSSTDNAAAFIPNTINIVTATNLYRTVGIEVCRLDCATYTPLFTIGNPKLIETLVVALDTDMPLRPHARCPAVYQLRFIQADGRHYDFGYTCQMMTPTFLRGNQAFWKDQDAIAPDAFNELMLPMIAPHELEEAAW